MAEIFRYCVKLYPFNQSYLKLHQPDGNLDKKAVDIAWMSEMVKAQIKNQSVSSAFVID